MSHSDFHREVQCGLGDPLCDDLSPQDASDAREREEFVRRFPECSEQHGEPVDEDRGPVVSAQVAAALSNTVTMGAEPADGTAEINCRGQERGSRVLGNYELLELIGQGGMSSVYRARQTTLGRIVAVKVISEGQFATPAAIKRFRVEAELAARLHHSQIVSIHEIGEQDGLHFFSMDYVEGQTLARLLRDGPLAPRRAAEYVRSIARTITYAHQEGLLHRDLKPSNVMIDGNDQPVVVDFGLARSIKASSELTRTGEVLGTASYMSPEQAMPDGGGVGVGTDIYSLGAVLYALLSGHPPFQAESPAATLVQVCSTEPVPLRKLNPDIPLDLETICLKCLAKKPAQRYHSAAALADDLHRYLAGRPIQARPLGPAARTWRWCRGNPAWATLLTTLLVAALVIVAVTLHYGATVHALNHDLSDRNFRLISTNSELESALHTADVARRRNAELLYAADVRLAARAWSEGDVHQAHTLLERHRPQPGESDLRGLEWRLLHNLMRADCETLQDHHGDVYYVQCSPDGHWLASAGKDATIRIYSADDLAQRLVIESGQSEVNGVAFHPDGRQLVSAGDDGTLRIWDLSTGEERLRIDAHEDLAFQAAFLDDGGRLVSCGREPYARLWDARTGELLGEYGPHPRSLEALAVAADGSALLTVADRLYVWNLAERRRVWEHDIPVRATSVACSPDGRWVGVGSLENRAYLFRSEEGRATAPQFVSPHNDGVQCVAFSPAAGWGADGDLGGVVRLWRLPLDAPPTSNAIANALLADRTWQAHDGRIWMITFSPDGSRLITAGEDGAVRVWPLNDDSPTRTAMFPEDPPDALDVLTDGSILTAGSRRLVRLDDALAPASVILSVGPADRLTTLDVARESGRIAVGTYGGSIRLRDGVREWPEWRNESAGDVQWLGISPAGDRLIAVCYEETLAFTLPGFDVIPGLNLPRCDGIALSDDGRLLACSPKDVDAVEVHDLDRCEIIQAFPRHDGPIYSVCFSPDARLVAASDGRRMKLYEISSGQLIGELVGHQGDIRSACFTPDGRSVVTTGWDRTVRIWSVGTQQELLVLGSDDGVRELDCQVQVTPDGHIVHLVDGKLTIYDATRRDQ